MVKICTICKQEKPLSSFYDNPLTKNGKGSQCKECDSSESKRINNQRKRELISKMGGKCAICGYSKNAAALEFHHTDKNKEFNLSRSYKKYVSVLFKEIQKCELLCSNCHRECHNPDLVLAMTG